jgi:hypothetical protein
MWLRKIQIMIFFSALACGQAFAQENAVKADSTKLYKDIETFSKRSRFNTFLYRLIFKPVSIISKKEIKRKSYKKLVQKPYTNFQGKIIRKINIVTLDPFGYSVSDTTAVNPGGLIKTANSFHVKSQLITIKNLLLIKENEPFNSFFVKESERLIRNQKYVHDVFFYPVLSGLKKDSVDLYIRELDIWSIIPSGSISSSHIHAAITDKNFLGTGNEFQNAFSRNLSTGISSFNTFFQIPNIRTTYIESYLHFGIDGYGNIRKSVAFERPFYSPYAKWGGGIAFATQVKKDSLKYLTPLYGPLNFKRRTQDFWGGSAIRIFKGSTEDELATNLIMAIRYLRIRYNQKPSDINNTDSYYSNQDFYLAGIGVSTRKYVQDTYIFKYGTIEDVPVGKVFELTGGFQLRNNLWRQYLGMRFSIGNYNEWGYFSTNIEYGSFFRSSHSEQGAVTASINYFTGLFEIGKWKFRQFVKPQITLGINRFAYDSLTINDGYGLDGFNSPTLSGTNRILFTLQTQSYSPYMLAGFHFGPFLVCSAGMLGDSHNGFKNKRLYTQFGFGILIKNENLIFNTFQISISFFPSIPGNGLNIIKLNSFTTNDFGFRDFEIGRPEPIMYR